MTTTGTDALRDPSQRLALACALPAEPDPSFDRFARLVRAQLGVPVALVSLVTRTEQVFPGAVGLPDAVQDARRTPLTHSVCQHVVLAERTLLLPDIRRVPALQDNLAFGDLGVVAYAGAPLRDADGVVIGSLCAIDGTERRWTDDDRAVLKGLAEACSTELALRQLRARADDSERRTRVLLSLAEGLARATTVDEITAALATMTASELGVVRAEVVVPHGRTDPASPVGAVLRDGRSRWYLDLDAVRAAHPAPDPAPDLAPDLVRGGDGARAYLPLTSGGALHGVLALTWPDRRQLDGATRRVLGAVTRYTAVAVARAVLLAGRREAAETLQAALLTALPDVPGLELHATYVPAAQGERVGGDWYDAVALPDGATALVIGDVVGHDVRAAAAMGQLRSTLRALTWAFHGPPSRILDLADRAGHELGSPTGATCLLGVLRPSPDRPGHHVLTWSSAGHLPPVLVTQDGDARALPGRSALLLGVPPGPGDRAPRPDHEWPVPPGATLLLCTDGLVERRDRSLSAGLAALVAAVARSAQAPLPDLVRGVVADLLPASGRRPEDDVAVLAVRVPALPRGRPPERTAR